MLLLAAKLATIAVPFTFKWATDALVGAGHRAGRGHDWLAGRWRRRSLLTLAYGGMRILMAVLTQVRDGMFAKVAMHAVRRLALRTFVHMHELSLRFHLERKTGGLTRVLERGRNGIETIVRMVHPATRADHRRVRADRLACCCGSSTGAMSWSIAVTVALYIGYTYLRDRVAHRHPPQDERERHRRQHQGDRLAAQLRDGEIFLRRGARGRALRPLDGALRGGERQGLHLARRAQCRAGDDLHARARRGDGDVRLRHPRRHQDGRRFRA